MSLLCAIHWFSIHYRTKLEFQSLAPRQGSWWVDPFRMLLHGVLKHTPNLKPCWLTCSSWNLPQHFMLPALCTYYSLHRPHHSSSEVQFIHWCYTQIFPFSGSSWTFSVKNFFYYVLEWYKWLYYSSDLTAFSLTPPIHRTENKLLFSFFF